MARPVVVITGAAGNLGSRLRAQLEEAGSHELRLLDLDPRGDSRIQQADLAQLDETWMRCFEGADLLVHFAAASKSETPWPALTGPNVDGLLNVYHAAVTHGVKQVVLASSIWALAARRDDTDPIGTPPPNPGSNAYGATKLFAERVARFHFQAHGISSTVLRLGGIGPGENRPWRHPDRWENDGWLSTPDFHQAMDCILKADLKGCQIINLTSTNPAARWSLGEAEALVGYRPGSVYAPPPPKPPLSLYRRIRRFLGRIKSVIYNNYLK